MSVGEMLMLAGIIMVGSVVAFATTLFFFCSPERTKQRNERSIARRG